ALFVEFGGGVLAAVIDGLGHGHEAAAAARGAERVLAAQPSVPIDELVRLCHDTLRGTRGVAMSLASIDTARGTLSWLGVGNVDGVLVRGVVSGAGRDEGLITAGGIVGYRMPTLHVREHTLHAGDTLVLASDGVKQGFRAEALAVRGAQQIAEDIIARWAHGKDDACVLVARFRGSVGDGTRVEIDGEADISQARI